MSTLERAIEIAMKAHKGQMDKAGAPYILHPLRVMMSLDSESEMIVGILHDVIEDSAWTAEQLREEGFSEEIIEALDCLTKREGESYEDFIDRAMLTPLSRRVKIADLKDNMDLSHIGDLKEQDLSRLARYHSALRVLSKP